MISGMAEGVTSHNMLVAYHLDKAFAALLITKEELTGISLNMKLLLILH